MYCKHCGQQIDDGAKFCQHCGKGISEDAPNNTSNTEATEEKPKKKRSIFKRWWFWVLAVIFLFAMCSRPAVPAVTHPNVSEADYKAMCTEIRFDDLARNPDNYKGQMFKFTGEVIQVVMGTNTMDLRMNVTKVENEGAGWVYYEDTIYITVQVEEGADKILVDDIITVYGICCGDYTYESVLGSQITLPRIDVLYYDMTE